MKRDESKLNIEMQMMITDHYEQYVDKFYVINWFTYLESRTGSRTLHIPSMYSVSKLHSESSSHTGLEVFLFCHNLWISGVTGMHHQAYQHQYIYQLRRKEEIPRHLTKETKPSRPKTSNEKSAIKSPPSEET